MKLLNPNNIATGFVRPVVVADSSVGEVADFKNRANIPPQAQFGKPEYVTDSARFIELVKENLAKDPSRWLTALAIYTTDLAERGNVGGQGRAIVAQAVQQSGAAQRAATPVEVGMKPEQIGGATATAYLNRMRGAVAEMFASGTIAEPRSPEDVAAIYATAQAVGLPLGNIRVRTANADNVGKQLEAGVKEILAKYKLSNMSDALRAFVQEAQTNGVAPRLLVEITRPERVGFVGGGDIIQATLNTDTGAIALYAEAAARTRRNSAIKVPKAVVAVVADKLAASGFQDTSPEAVTLLVRAFASAEPGSAVSAFRSLALGTPDIAPRLQRILRKYGTENLINDTRLTALQRASRVIALLFAGDSGLRAVQTQAMRADLQIRSERVREAIAKNPQGAVWDVLITGQGPQGQAALDRIVAVNPELRCLAVDGARVARNFGRSGVSFAMNSRNGQDDGRPGGNGRGNINPVGASLLTTDISGTNMPKPRDVDDAGVNATYEATQRGNVDVLFENPIVTYEHRSNTTAEDAASWPAAIRATFADGTVAYTHKLVVANGFGVQPKKFGDDASDAAFSKALEVGRTAIANWQTELARVQVEGLPNEPQLEARVMTVADAMAAADTPGADVLAPFRAVAPTPSSQDEKTASVTFVGFGDSNRTALELVLGLAPDEAYRNTPAQLGQIKDMTWVVGDGGPETCFEFLVGRDYLSRSLSAEAYAKFKEVLQDKKIEALFGNDAMMSEIRSKLAPIDQNVLDGARTRYQKISGAILKGIIRLEASTASDFVDNGDSVTVKLSKGGTLTSRRLIDGRGYEAEIGALAGLVDPEAPDPRKRIKDCGDSIQPLFAPLEEGVIGRDDQGVGKVAKTVKGFEDCVFWVGPGNGGDLVSKVDIARETKVGANTVSLFINVPRTIATIDNFVAVGPTLVRRSITEVARPKQAVAVPASGPAVKAKAIDFADLVPTEITADSRLEVHARLAAMLSSFAFNGFATGTAIDVTIRKPNIDRTMRQFAGTSIELSSASLGRETLSAIADIITSDKRFTSLMLQMLQDSDVALKVQSTLEAGGTLIVPTSRLVSIDSAEAVASSEEAAAMLPLLEAVRTGSDSSETTLATLQRAVSDGVITQRELSQAVRAGGNDPDQLVELLASGKLSAAEEFRKIGQAAMAGRLSVGEVLRAIDAGTPGSGTIGDYYARLRERVISDVFLDYGRIKPKLVDQISDAEKQRLTDAAFYSVAPFVDVEVGGSPEQRAFFVNLEKIAAVRKQLIADLRFGSEPTVRGTVQRVLDEGTISRDVVLETLSATILQQPAGASTVGATRILDELKRGTFSVTPAASSPTERLTSVRTGDNFRMTDVIDDIKNGTTTLVDAFKALNEGNLAYEQSTANRRLELTASVGDRALLATALQELAEPKVKAARAAINAGTASFDDVALLALARDPTISLPARGPARIFLVRSFAIAALEQQLARALGNGKAEAAAIFLREAQRLVAARELSDGDVRAILEDAATRAQTVPGPAGLNQTISKLLTNFTPVDVRNIR